MTKKDLFEIALKIFGLYLLTIAFDSLLGLVKFSAIAFAADKGDKSSGMLFFMVSVLRTIFFTFGAWSLIFRAHVYAEKLIKMNPRVSATINIGKRDLGQVLLVAAGVIIVYFSIEDVLSALMMSGLADLGDLPREKKQIVYLIQLGVPLARLLTGLGLIFFSKKMTQLLVKEPD